MADYGGSTTNPAYRDFTQTPRWLFNALHLEFNFILDVAALPVSALCDIYLTPDIDALAVDWGDYIPADERSPWCWCNPPYSDIGPWVVKAMVEQHNGIGTVLLVPQDQSAEWYPGDNASEVRIITGYYDDSGKWKTGRISFVNAETGVEMQGNNKGSMLLVFAPGYRGPCRMQHVSKGELIRKSKTATDHIADVSNMVAEPVTCLGCNRQYPDGSPEAEFIGWHGECAICHLQSEMAKRLGDGMAA